MNKLKTFFKQYKWDIVTWIALIQILTIIPIIVLVLCSVLPVLVIQIMNTLALITFFTILHLSKEQDE